MKIPSPSKTIKAVVFLLLFLSSAQPLLAQAKNYANIRIGFQVNAIKAGYLPRITISYD